jgi:hypothetical protein
MRDGTDTSPSTAGDGLGSDPTRVGHRPRTFAPDPDDHVVT